MPNYSQQALLFRHQLLRQPTAMLPTAMLLFRHKSTLVMYKKMLNFTYLSCALKLSYERCFSEIQHFFLEFYKLSQSWMFIGRTDAEAETPILWPPDAKSSLIGKDPDAGKN